MKRLESFALQPRTPEAGVRGSWRYTCAVVGKVAVTALVLSTATVTTILILPAPGSAISTIPENAIPNFRTVTRDVSEFAALGALVALVAKDSVAEYSSTDRRAVSTVPSRCCPLALKWLIWWRQTCRHARRRIVLGHVSAFVGNVRHRYLHVENADRRSCGEVHTSCRSTLYSARLFPTSAAWTEAGPV